MMRLINRAIPFLGYASYLNAAALAVLGVLTVIIALFKGASSAQIGGAGVVIVAVFLALATAAALNTHRRSTP